MSGWTDAWIYKIEEAPIDPNMPIIDPHQHIWTDRFPLYVQHFGDASAANFLEGVRRSGHNIVATVHLTIQADYRDDVPNEWRTVAETDYLEGLAAELDRAGGKTRLVARIVGGVEMLLGDKIAPILDAHIAASPKRFCGVRYPVAWHPSPIIPFKEEHPGILVEPAFIQAAKVLAKRGLSLDAFVFYNQLNEIEQLARAVPDLRIVLNHSGGPITDPRFSGEADEIWKTWSTAIKKVAACPNVVLKLGGMGMLPLAGALWTARPMPPTSEELAAWLRPWQLHALECFGVERAMFQSNFPTERPSANYGTVWNAFKRLAVDFSVAEKQALFFETARKTYNIPA